MPVVHKGRKIPIKALIYGVPGSGKTTFAASAADHDDMRNVLFLSVEGGMLSVPANDHILLEEIRNNGANAAVDKVEELFWQLVARDAKKTPWVEGLNTIVVDSGTELQTLDIEYIMRDEISKGRSKNIDVPWMQDYGRSTVKLKRLFRYFRDLPYNVIITCLSQPVYDGKGENAPIKSIEPTLTEKLRESVKGYVDHVWYAYTIEGQTNPDTGEKSPNTFHLLTQPAGKFFAKTRGQNFSKALGNKVNEPYLPEIYDLLQKTEGESK